MLSNNPRNVFRTVLSGAAAATRLVSPGVAGFLVLAGCLFDERTAGTSTTITNPSPTVYGSAIFLNGVPATGARVHLRSTECEVAPSGAPYARLAASAVVDDTGGFSMPMPIMLKEYYLILEEVPGAGDPTPPDSAEVQLRRLPDGLPRNGHMGTFRLDIPGSLGGTVAFGDTSGDSTRWIGARGTDNFTPVAKDGSFVLRRLAPGLQHLVLVTVPVSAPGAYLPRALKVIDMVGSVEVKSGGIVDVGRLTRNDS